MVSTIIGSNLSPLVAMFISTDIIYGKLASALEEYLKEDENQKNTVLAINEGFDRISKNKITDLLASYNEGERASSIGSVSEFILNSVLTGSFISSVIEDIEKGLCEFATINELLAYFDVNYMEVLKNFIRNKVDSFIMSNGFQLIVEGFVQDGVIQILNTPLKEFINENQENITAMSSNIARDVFDKFVENEAADLVEVLNIPQIVEERINSFDVAFAEKIIIDIANKELSAITWLGALLGAIIGVLSPILS